MWQKICGKKYLRKIKEGRSCSVQYWSDNLNFSSYVSMNIVFRKKLFNTEIIEIYDAFREIFMKNL